MCVSIYILAFNTRVGHEMKLNCWIESASINSMKIRFPTAD